MSELVKCAVIFRVTDDARLFRIVAGDHNRYESEGTEQGRFVTEIIKHGNYDDRTTDNDIALLVLDSPLTYNRLRSGKRLMKYVKKSDM